MVQGDIAAASLAALYLSVVILYAAVLQPEWALITTFWHAAYLITLTFAAVWTCFMVYRISPLHPLHAFPGPVLNRVTELPLAYTAARLDRHIYLCKLHETYGPIVRTGKFRLRCEGRVSVASLHTSGRISTLFCSSSPAKPTLCAAPLVQTMARHLAELDDSHQEGARKAQDRDPPSTLRSQVAFTRKYSDI